MPRTRTEPISTVAICLGCPLWRREPKVQQSLCGRHVPAGWCMHNRVCLNLFVSDPNFTTHSCSYRAPPEVVIMCLIALHS